MRLLFQADIFVLVLRFLYRADLFVLGGFTDPKCVTNACITVTNECITVTDAFVTNCFFCFRQICFLGLRLFYRAEMFVLGGFTDPQMRYRCMYNHYRCMYNRYRCICNPCVLLFRTSMFFSLADIFSRAEMHFSGVSRT